jgi:NADP-dependent 3-hydroxy acid dehydrogenase YdfG
VDLGLSGRACVVTGASKGIGRATARMLCAEGADVMLVARSEERLIEAADECAAAGQDASGRAESLVADVTDPEAAELITGEAVERLGQLDVLINNAGNARRRGSAGDARARLGPHRQRLQLIGEAALGHHARVLRGQGRRALAIPALRRSVRG